MSEYLKKLGYDDLDFSEEEDDNEEYYNSNQQEEEEEVNDETLNIIELVLDSKKKIEEVEKKKREEKYEMKLKKKKDQENDILFTLEALQSLQKEEEIKNNNKKKKLAGQVLQNVHYKLNVLQCTKMFFESIRPTYYTQYVGNPKYEEEVRYILNFAYKISEHTGERYTNYQEMIEKNIAASRLFKTESKMKGSLEETIKNCFNRHDFCSTLNNGHLFIYGGRIGNSLQDDLIHYNLMNNHIIVYKNLHYLSHNSYTARNTIYIPPIVNSNMVLAGETLFIFGGNTFGVNKRMIDALTEPMRNWSYYNRRNCEYRFNEMIVFAIANVFNPNKITNGMIRGPPPSSTNYEEQTHPAPLPGSAFVPMRSHFSIAYDVDGGWPVKVYLFGGKNTNGLNDFYKYTFSANNPEFDVTAIEKPKQKGVVHWPSPRFDHSSCMISNLIFIFGGYNGKTALNDLYMFDVNTEKWTEIMTESIPPPPLFKHQSFACNNQSFYVFGGRMNDTDKAMTSNTLYRFDIVDKKWNIMEIISDEMNTTSIMNLSNDENSKVIEKDYSIYNPPVSGHTCYVYQNRMIRIGGIGVNDSSVQPFVQLWNLPEPGKTIPLCSYLQQKKKDGFLCDVVFRVKDSNSDDCDDSSFSFITAHKAIIKVRCPTLHEKIVSSEQTMEKHLLSIEDDNNSSPYVTLVDITECDTNIFEAYLDYLYIAEININEKQNVKTFLDLVKNWSLEKHYPLVQKICLISEQMDLSVTKEILRQLHKDLCSLINDHTYSDLILVLDPPQQKAEEEEEIPLFEDDDNLYKEDNEMNLVEEQQQHNGIAVHKLIMARSPFFSRMFVTSGMSESKEKVVHLTDYSKEVMLEVLTFLYTDTLRLTPKNCIGILIYCLLFDLTEISNCCRRLICTLLDVTNVWSIMDIALLYNDKILESECESFILKRYELLSTSFGFSNLPDTTRIKIKQQYEKRNKHQKL
ncbi:hypothetical protein ABK040_015155 [Willaertia magna]